MEIDIPNFAQPKIKELQTAESVRVVLVTREDACTKRKFVW